jgi:hypothetical protein
LSDAVAPIITAEPEIVAPAAGVEIETVGGVVSESVENVMTPLEAEFPFASVELIWK